MAVHSSWVKGVYPLFCKAANVTWPPPYKDFAKELAGAMPRKRIWLWKGGKRIRAVTAYSVRDPAADVLGLTVRKRA